MNTLHLLDGFPYSCYPFSSTGCLYFLAHHAAVRNLQGRQRSQLLQHVEVILKNIRCDLHQYAGQCTFCHSLPESPHSTQCAFMYRELLSQVLIITHFRSRHNYLGKFTYPPLAMYVLLSSNNAWLKLVYVVCWKGILDIFSGDYRLK